MAVKNTKLGGVDFVREHPTFQDLNDTNNAIIKASIVGQTQIPFSILKSAGAFTNEGNLCADRTTVAAGVKGTINTGSSTGVFSTNKYILNFGKDASGDTTFNPDTFTDPENAFDNNSGTYANITPPGTVGECSLGKTFSAKNLQYCKINCSALSQRDSAGVTRTVFAALEYYNGTDWVEIQVLFNVTASTTTVSGSYNDTLNISSYSDIQGLRVRFTVDQGNVDRYARVNILEYGSYNLSDTVISDTGTLTLVGDEKMIAVYNSATIPTGTSMKCQLSDETKTISAEHTLTANGTTIIPITTTPTATDVLKLTFTLETTDNEITPEWYGFGCYRYRGD